MSPDHQQEDVRISQSRQQKKTGLKRCLAMFMGFCLILGAPLSAYSAEKTHHTRITASQHASKSGKKKIIVRESSGKKKMGSTTSEKKKKTASRNSDSPKKKFLKQEAAKNTHTKKHAMSGIASFYSENLHQTKTANGERYDKNEMTAASPTLPFGTLVRVTNQRNGRHCVVRINDRGPYQKGWIIDLSQEAARQIHMLNSGTVPVKLEVVSDLEDES